jgi:hypothetical protein
LTKLFNSPNNTGAIKLRLGVLGQPGVLSYPDDPDNKFDSDEHGLHGFNDLTGCHDIGVFVELRLAAAACAEQTHLWRIRRDDIPATRDPLWGPMTTRANDPGDVAVDFWQTASFTRDGKYVQADNESFGSGFPTVTNTCMNTGQPADTSGVALAEDRRGRRIVLETDQDLGLFIFRHTGPLPDRTRMTTTRTRTTTSDLADA